MRILVYSGHLLSFTSVPPRMHAHLNRLGRLPHPRINNLVRCFVSPALQIATQSMSMHHFASPRSAPTSPNNLELVSLHMASWPSQTFDTDRAPASCSSCAPRAFRLLSLLPLHSHCFPVLPRWSSRPRPCSAWLGAGVTSMCRTDRQASVLRAYEHET